MICLFFGFLSLLNVYLVSSADRYELSDEYKAVGYNYRQMFLVMHYTVSDLTRSLRILTGDSVSSHYLVPETPINNKRKIYRLVPEEYRAWTQGVSQWGSRSNLNDQGIGVEIVNSGYIEENGKKKFFPFPDYQIDSVIQLSKDIIPRYNIKPINVIGHADVAPCRKEDPGPLFPWKKLYENGIGAWPDDSTVQKFMSTLSDNVDILQFQKDLKRYGYKVNTDGLSTTETKCAVTAFQMHFRQSCYNGKVDKETHAVLKALLEKYF